MKNIIALYVREGPGVSSLWALFFWFFFPVLASFM